MSTPFNYEDMEYEAYALACERFDTDAPTVDQVNECYQELLERAYDEAENYYNQDGDN